MYNNEDSLEVGVKRDSLQHNQHVINYPHSLRHKSASIIWVWSFLPFSLFCKLQWIKGDW